MKYTKYKLFIHTGLVGADHEDYCDIAEIYTREQWDAMTDAEQQEELQSHLDDYVSGKIDYGFCPAEQET
jgi:hypothetical protein